MYRYDLGYRTEYGGGRLNVARLHSDSQTGLRIPRSLRALSTALYSSCLLF
jgi:hypothetical protein